MTDPALEFVAEDALLLHFGDCIDPVVNARVHAAARALREAALPGVIDIAPAYATLLVRFDPLVWTSPVDRQPCAGLTAHLRSTLQNVDAEPSPPPLSRRERGSNRPPVASQTIEIPVCYGGEYGADLDAVAKCARLTTTQVVTRHAAGAYRVAMLGFAPGFPYLIGLDATLHVPRHANPRTRVPAGSIAIGGAQTGIYPRELPGGWHLIGRTPRVLFDPVRASPCLLAPGDRVRFHAIDAAEFERLSGAGA